MSKQDAQAFLEKMKNDKDFKNEIANLETSEERIEKVKHYGYEFTKEEIDDVKSEMIDDTELDKVAGGVNAHYKNAVLYVCQEVNELLYKTCGKTVW
jgi:predicted ribosomally synthesized peptide with nif11-like leader